MTGYTREEVIGRTPRELGFWFSDDDLKTVMSELRTRGFIRNFESDMFTKSGARRSRLLSAVLIDFAQQRCILSFSRDITERKQAEQTRALLASIVQSAAEAILSGDLEWKITSWNPGAEKLFGYSAAEIMGRPLDLLIPPDRLDEIKKTRAGITRGQGLKHFESPRVRKDGTLFDASITVSPIYDAAGAVVGVSAITKDISVRKKFEADLARARDLALEAARARAEFLANMSHEIRTPLNGIVGMTHLLLDTSLTQEQREMAEMVRTSSDSLMDIVNDVLDFSKISAGKLVFEEIDFDLVGTVESAVELFAERAQSKQIELASSVEDNLPEQLRGDSGRLRQILANLISNAVKFTQQGEVVVRASKESETDKNVTIRFEVVDTGIGIPHEVRGHLFDPFTQADSSTTRRFGGTGLGLAISAQLVRRMSGEIGFQSELGKGTTFHFTAKFGKQRAGTSTVLRRKLDKLEGLRVLVVDDNATNRQIVRRQIASWGIFCDSATSGTEALAALRDQAKLHPYDVVILDMQMPGMDGIMLARAIRSEASIARIKLIMMSSLGTKGDHEGVETKYIDAWLTKPVKQSRLFDCLADAGLMAHESQEQPRPARSRRPVQATAAEQSLLGRTGQVRILVAEDNPVNQKVALRQLGKLGYSADAVSNGAEAIEALSRIPYSAVLMDCQMPEMDGYQATEHIRRLEAGARHTIVIAMTAHALEGDREKCLAAGMDDYISKPVKSEELASTIERWLSSGSKALPDSTESTTLGDADAVEAERLVELREIQRSPGNANFLTELIDLFRADLPVRLAAMSKALAHRDAPALASAAHTLRGACGNFGAKRAQALCLSLEQQSRVGSLDGAETLVRQLQEECERVSRELENERAKRG